MHIAIGYHWFAIAAAYDLERALRALGHIFDYPASFRRALGHGQSCCLHQAAAPDVHRLPDLLTLYHVGFAGSIARVHRTSARALPSFIPISFTVHA